MSSAGWGTPAEGQLAGYQLAAEIGRGGMAIVYRALDVRLGRTVALKILAPQLAQDESFRRRFIHESRAAAAVDHPHIVPVFEAGEAGGSLFIAMRYVGTGDVRTLLEREGSLPVARAVTITSQVASALDAAHAHGLVHRDIKPANMLLAESADGHSDHVYLSDFGLSKHSLAPSGLTSTGQFMGTLDYVAPEQIEGREVDGRADLYALACTAFEMLTGAPPFRRAENLALMWAQLSEPAPPPSERRPGLPLAVDQVMSRALAKSPDARYRTCLEFAVALRGACLAPPAASAALRDDVALPAAPPGGEARRPRTEPAPAAPASWTPSESAAWPAGWASSGGQAAQASRAAADAPAGGSWNSSEPPGGWVSQQAAGPYENRAVTRPPLAGHRQPARRRHARAWLAGAALLAVICLAVVGIRLLHQHRAALTAAQGSTTSAPAVAAITPAGTVEAYFRAINKHRYLRAWRLGGRHTGQPYSKFVTGYKSTARDVVSIMSTSGDVVSARLTATHVDGTVQAYVGTYTVSHGTIVSSDVNPVG